MAFCKTLLNIFKPEFFETFLPIVTNFSGNHRFQNTDYIQKREKPQIWQFILPVSSFESFSKVL